MRAGRKPKATHLKLLAGHPGHRPLNESEPKPEGVDETPDPPAHLSGEADAVLCVQAIEQRDRVTVADADCAPFDGMRSSGKADCRRCEIQTGNA